MVVEMRPKPRFANTFFRLKIGVSTQMPVFRFSSSHIAVRSCPIFGWSVSDLSIFTVVFYRELPRYRIIVRDHCILAVRCKGVRVLVKRRPSRCSATKIWFFTWVPVTGAVYCGNGFNLVFRTWTLISLDLDLFWIDPDPWKSYCEF
jgi:hypothetical protein